MARTDRDAEIEPAKPTRQGAAAIWRMTELRRREADRLSQREQAFWTVQRSEIQRRLGEAPSVTGDGFSARGFTRGSKGDRPRPAYRFFGPVLTGSAVAATLMVVTFSSLGPWSGPSDPVPGPELRSTAELRGLFAEIGQSLARHEPLALVPALPVQQALDSSWTVHRQEDSPWNTTVKLHSQKEL